MTAVAEIPLALAALWLVLALLLPRLPVPRRSLATRCVVALGVPVLGLLTLHFGPAAGLAGLAAGLALLWRQRLRPSRGPAAPAAPAE